MALWALVALAVGAVISKSFQSALEDIAPLAEWVVAAGTLGLAGATFLLARQVAGQLEAGLRPVVSPIAPADWALGGVPASG